MDAGLPDLPTEIQLKILYEADMLPRLYRLRKALFKYRVAITIPHIEPCTVTLLLRDSIDKWIEQEDELRRFVLEDKFFNRSPALHKLRRLTTTDVPYDFERLRRLTTTDVTYRVRWNHLDYLIEESPYTIRGEQMMQLVPCHAEIHHNHELVSGGQ